MSNYLKYFRKEFEKYAQDKGLDMPPAGPRAAVSGGQVAGQVGQQGPAGTVAPGQLLNDVVKMQDQLINLANTVVKENGAFNVTPQQEIVTGTPQNGDSQAMSRTSFADFMTKHYVRQSDLPAVEFNPDPKAANLGDKNTNQATRMNLVMDTMRRIGGANNELKTDGRWGKRTNAALHNAYALAYSLLKMSSDFKFKPRSYGESNLAEFKAMIPADATALSDPDKEKYAPEIIKHLKSITALFQEVKAHILQNPGYQSFIEGDEAFATYKKQAPVKAPGLTPEQLQLSSQIFPQGFEVPISQDGQNTVTFQPANLVSLDAFKQTIAKVENDYKVKLDPYNVLTQISRKIGEANS